MLVSIVINNYNYGNFVAQAIESALAQTYPAVEVVVVDDGSRDDSLAVISRYGDRVLVIAKANGGQGSAYNIGFLRSHGELVIFLDADDWLYPQAVQQIVVAWRPGMSKLQFRLDMVGRQGQPFGRWLPRDLHDSEQAQRLVCEFGTYGTPPGSGNAFSAAYLRQVMPMDEGAWRIGADSVTVLLAPAHGRVESIQTALGAYRIHRDPNDGALLYNNSISGLGAEYERLLAAKHMVVEGLERAHLEPRLPLLYLAPWEARILVMGRRFGDAALRQRLAAEPQARLPFILRSIWAWPVSSVWRKLLLTGWVLAVCGLPAPMALRLARLHRRASGQPVPA
ncbi:glycosyltransferase family 2 protein [Sphaerotilus microaerophilus]|uniref:Glycosyltransferase 2-like domain-containing protein n=1 Tax=Sphaerotilus microaerophilus TaxID=2914710 RepID=A0ABN6PRZ4_9BURK|nr:glycosyltransferase family A protein [Sphaerotilus sp. FB-5]BDI06847.1 hypothetical protein CATMQ487_38170 [Sphaerotilus sp. FB-5]